MNRNSKKKSTNDRVYLEEVDEAILKQFEFEQNVNRICEEIQDEFSGSNKKIHFPKENTFASVQLLTIDNKVIETVAGKFGENIKNKGWTGISRHHVDEKHVEIRDMHANIIIPLLQKDKSSPKILIVSGWHQNFDEWIYEYYQHQRYVRIFIPIILLRDSNGKIVQKDWHKDWVLETEPELKPHSPQSGKIGFSKEITMHLPQNFANYEINVIGTFAIGYFDNTSEECDSEQYYKNLIEKIPTTRAVELTKLVAKQSFKIYECTLANVFDTIAEQIRKKVNAFSTSIHYLKNLFSDNEFVDYYIKSSSGDSTEFLNKCPIRENGLGQQAITTGETIALAGDILKKNNEAIYNNGIKVMVASPLKINLDKAGTLNETPENHGILYVHFQNEGDCDQEKINWIALYAKKAVFAIRTAINYVNIRNDNRVLEGFEGVSHLLLQRQPFSEELHNYIAGMTKNILSADVVSIYHIINDDDEKNIEFSKPFTAGALLKEKNFEQPSAFSGTRLLLEYKEDLYFAKISKNDAIMNNPLGRIDGKEKFVERENISSSFAVKIRADNKDVGVMFVHYRRLKHKPTLKELKLIKLISSWAAIVIKNKRDFDQRANSLPYRISNKYYSLLSSNTFMQEFSIEKTHKAFVLSVDIRKSTGLMLNTADEFKYAKFIFQLEKDMRKILQDNCGIIDRFTGDGMIAYFPNFYSGQDGGLYCARAAHRCHQKFKDTFKKHEESFQVLPTDVGFGIGIDYGDISMCLGEETNQELLVVGSPVVYASRFSSSAKANHTAVNIQAKKELLEIIKRKNVTTRPIFHEPYPPKQFE